MKKTLILISGVAAMAAGLSACGRMADLEAPTARTGERAQRDRLSEPMAESATVLKPISQHPIDGGPSDPFGRPPQ